jgi:hypothetical protein
MRSQAFFDSTCRKGFGVCDFEMKPVHEQPFRWRASGRVVEHQACSTQSPAPSQPQPQQLQRCQKWNAGANYTLNLES